MNKIIKLVLFTLCFSASSKITLSQIQFFDSVITVAASPIYDYRNPVFSNYPTYSGSGFSWIAYERHNGNSSDIIVRKAQYSFYDNEIVITNTSNALNINPTLDQRMLVWQSNARGNWDLYYSVLGTDGNWSAPAILDSSEADVTNPYVRNNNTGPEQYNFTYVAYQKNNAIGLKRYKTLTGIWDNDTIVTDGINEDIDPLIMKGNFSNQLVVYFLRKYSGGITKLNQKVFYDNYNGGAVTWENVYEIYQPGQQRELTVSYVFSEYLTYSYDTLNTSHILITSLNGQNNKAVVTKYVPGKHIRGKGTLMPIITDDLFYQFSAFCTLSQYSDSLCLTFINRPSTNYPDPQYKKIYAGDTGTVIGFDLSQPVFSLTYFYRIKAVWEKTSGGRTSLVESHMTDYLSGISNNNSSADGYYLNQNYPNPFNPVTHLEFGISDLGFVSLKVYDALGKVVRTLVNESKPAGNYKVEFDGSDLPSGVYFYKLEAGEFTETMRMILLK